MAYVEQVFTSGQVLKAEHLNYIERGIKELDDKVSSANDISIDNIVRCKNLIHSWTEGYVVSPISAVPGDPYPLSAGSCSGFIRLEKGVTYILDIRGEATPFPALYYFYDENKTAITSNHDVGSLTKVEDGIYKFTANYPYIRLNKYTTTIEFALIKESEYVKDEQYNYKTIDEAMENVFREVSSDNTEESSNLIKSWLDNYIVTPNATVAGDTYAFSGGSCSDFIRLSSGSTYVLDIRGYTNPFPIFYCYYDINKTFISNGDTTGFSKIAEGIYELYVSNSNVAYVRFNKHTTVTMFALYKKSDFVVKPPETIWYALGDSITAGSYSDNNGKGVVAENAEWSYGKQIANNVGCKFVNLGQPGATLNSGIKDKVANVGADATIVTITGGANDYATGVELGTINDTDSTTVYGALKYMVQTIVSKAPLARIVLISPFIIKYGDSTIDTKWSRNYKHKTFNYDELNKAFKDVADYCNVEYIDGTTQSPTNIYNITNVQKDGLHPTVSYYSTIASWLQSKLF